MKKFSVTLAVFLAFYFSAISTASADEKKTLSKAEIQKCKENGGVVKNVGLMAIPKCVIPYADAGKACKGSSECTKTCLTMKKDIQIGDLFGF